MMDSNDGVQIFVLQVRSARHQQKGERSVDSKRLELGSAAAA